MILFTSYMEPVLNMYMVKGQMNGNKSYPIIIPLQERSLSMTTFIP